MWQGGFEPRSRPRVGAHSLERTEIEDFACRNVPTAQRCKVAQCNVASRDEYGTFSRVPRQGVRIVLASPPEPRA